MASASRNLFSMMTSLPRSICWTSPDRSSLAFAHPLDDPLFGRLNRQPAKVDKGNFFLEHVAHLEVGIFVLRLFQGDLRAGILHRFHYLAEAHHLDGALQLIHAE